MHHLDATSEEVDALRAKYGGQDQTPSRSEAGRWIEDYKFFKHLWGRYPRRDRNPGDDQPGGAGEPV